MIDISAAFWDLRSGCSGDYYGIEGAGYISTDPEKYLGRYRIPLMTEDPVFIECG